jgi:hypothetical protein
MYVWTYQGFTSELYVKCEYPFWICVIWILFEFELWIIISCYMINSHIHPLFRIRIWIINSNSNPIQDPSFKRDHVEIHRTLATLNPSCNERETSTPLRFYTIKHENFPRFCDAMHSPFLNLPRVCPKSWDVTCAYLN